MNLATLIKISRPRFWLYAAGTFWVGIAAGLQSIDAAPWTLIIVYLLYFIFPANVFIYGINDIGDGDTDKFNEKKDDKEHRLGSSQRNPLIVCVILSLVLGLVLTLFAPNAETKWLWALFLFLAFWYSTPPLRFKARPFIDALSNVHYAVIGFLAFTMVAGTLPPLWAVLAAWAWTASMHIFSAIPDIDSDKQANLNTTAIFLGAKASLWLCILLWLIAAILVILNLDSPLSYAALIYPVYAMYIALSGRSVASVYWHYPYINAALGLVLYVILLYPKL